MKVFFKEKTIEGKEMLMGGERKAKEKEKQQQQWSRGGIYINQLRNELRTTCADKNNLAWLQLGVGAVFFEMIIRDE